MFLIKEGLNYYVFYSYEYAFESKRIIEKAGFKVVIEFA